MRACRRRLAYDGAMNWRRLGFHVELAILAAVTALSVYHSGKNLLSYLAGLVP